MQSVGLSRVFCNTTVKKHQFFGAQLSLVQLSHPYMTTGKTIALSRQTVVGKVMSLLFNMLSSLVITFLPRSKRLLISWLQSPCVIVLEPPKIKSDTWLPRLHSCVAGERNIHLVQLKKSHLVTIAFMLLNAIGEH